MMSSAILFVTPITLVGFTALSEEIMTKVLQPNCRATRATFGICREAFRTDDDLYHIHEPELLIAGLFLRAAGKEVIYDIHEDLPRTVPYKLYVSKSIRKPLRWIVERMENAAARHMSGLVAATPAIRSRFRAMHS